MHRLLYKGVYGSMSMIKWMCLCCIGLDIAVS